MHTSAYGMAHPVHSFHHLQPIQRFFMQMPEHNIPALNRSCQNMVDTIHCWTPSLSPQPHVPTDFAPCTTSFDRFDTSAGRYLARLHPVAGMHIFFVFHLHCQVWEMHL